LLAAKELGKNVRWFTLTPEDVHRALYISDVFVLPSFTEGLSNALIEAVVAELPVICHPHPGGKYILEDDQWFVDLSTKGALANRLKILTHISILRLFRRTFGLSPSSIFMRV
jgi:glycosyltransferase involved in cell wall biosynthesis